MKLALVTFGLWSLFANSVFATPVDCSEAYGTPTKCELVTCNDKYKEFIGKWAGPFESYTKELSTQEKTIFRPYQNEVTYSENDCLKNVANGDTFIIGRKTDTYPAFQGLPQKESKGMLITGRKIDGSPFLKTFDDENGFNEYNFVYQNNAANLTIWELTIPASADGSPEMRFTTIDGQDFTEQKMHKRNVTVTMSLGPKQKPRWEGPIVKGYHSLLSKKQEAAMNEAKKLVGRYEGTWEIYPKCKSSNVMKMSDVTEAIVPRFLDNRAFISANSVVDVNGHSYVVTFEEGYYLNQDGTIGNRFVKMSDRSIDYAKTGENSWAWTYAVNLTPEEKTACGFSSSQDIESKIVGFKVIRIESNTEIDEVTDYLEISWIDQNGIRQSKRHINKKGRHTRSVSN